MFDINPQGEMQYLTLTCVTCHMAVGLLVVTKHHKTELLKLSTSVNQNIARFALLHIFSINAHRYSNAGNSDIEHSVC